MNEITIYNRIKKKIDKVKKDVKHAWWIGILWMVEAALVIIFLDPFPVLMSLLIFIPMAGVITLVFLALRKEYFVAKKFPKVYNDWIGESRFVQNVQQRSTQRAQPDPHYIKIDNNGLKYFDDVLSAYDDNKKIANTIYNAITDSGLVEEVKFYKKFKRFTKDMDEYRRLV